MEDVPSTHYVRQQYRSPFDASLDGQEFDAWLASVKAEAWDEGYQARQDEEYSEYIQYGVPYRDSIANPYRAED